MLILGHVGLSVGYARAWKKDVDVRWVAGVSLLQDYIDKPLRYLVAPEWTQHNSRTIAHSLLGSCMLVFLCWVFLRKRVKHAGLVSSVVLFHLIFDEMWNPELKVTLWWPWLGNGFYYFEKSFLGHLQRDLTYIGNITGEILGLSIISFLIVKYRLYRGPTRRVFLKTGLLR